MRQKTLSERDIAVLQAVADYIARNDGDAPTIRELCALTNQPSTSAVNHRLGKLAAMQLIRRKPNKSRSIRLTAAGEAYLGATA